MEEVEAMHPSIHSFIHMATTLNLKPSSPYETLAIERDDIIMVKPLQPIPMDLLSLSTIDNDPNLEILCQTIYVYPATEDINASSHLDPASVIQEGLSKALVHYYPLAGRLKRHKDGRLQVTCTGEGVPFLSARADCALVSLNHLYGIDVDAAKSFVFELEPSSEHGAHPLMIQVTRFLCGGFTVGMGLSHSISDGFGSAQFLRAVAELAGGKSEPSVKPVWERERLVSSSPATHHQEFIQLPLDQSSFATSPYMPSTDLIHESFDVTAESIRRLKASLSEDKACNGDRNEITNLTALEALGAFVWRSKFRALAMNLDGYTQFSLAIGIRNVVQPPLPEGYYGNAFVGRPVVLQGKALCEEPISRVAWMIRESKRDATKIEYLKSFLGIMEKFNQEKKKIEGNGATTIVTDWRHMDLAGSDFGWKRAVNVVPVPWNLFGYVDLCIFLPPFSLDPLMEGGVRVLVCLPSAAMPKFKEEMASLNSCERTMPAVESSVGVPPPRGAIPSPPTPVHAVCTDPKKDLASSGLMPSTPDGG